jgi:uncharacterized protein YdhG (YjbR/CyaY superfamily)
MADTSQKTKGTTSGFSADERAAMRARAKELKAEANKAGAEAAVVAAIRNMPEPDRSLAGRIHELVKGSAPQLAAKTWYGMPAYANAAGKVVCYFKGSSKFQTRYATFGFEDAAALDEGAMWPTCFALTTLSPSVEREIRSLVKKAAG